MIMVLLAICCAGTAWGQDSLRHVSPVRPETNKTLPPARGTDEEIIKRFIEGDTTAFLDKERRDSLRRAYKHYPLLTDVAVGVNFIEPVLLLMGQDYASVDVHATLNMWNRLQPVVEVGMGWAKTTPDDLNFTYRCKPSPYFKLGANYNFMFKSAPRYQAFLGVRLGYSTFKYDVTDVSYQNFYWQEVKQFDLKDISSNALWGEAVAGIKVGIWREWSLGWTIRYHGVFKYKSTENGRPWFIPGYGPRRRSVGFSFSLSYTLPLHRDKRPVAPSRHTLPKE
ncbi:MAG: hypothetical protein IJ775_03230 [Muribaculaceae bacterium]|nr:hypothetical protein [Muribaculaceae bacterium]